MTTDQELKIRIKPYQVADGTVSIGGIRWVNKWDVCIQCDTHQQAATLRAKLAQFLAKTDEVIT